MAKDKRYKTVKKLLEYGAITTLSQVLDIVPKTKLAHDLPMHHITFGKLLKHMDRFTLNNISRIASLIEVDRLEIVKLIFREIPEKRNVNPKKKTIPQPR